MYRFTGVDDNLLLKRLDEIDGELQDLHVSAHKSDMLTEEKQQIQYELGKRGIRENSAKDKLNRMNYLEKEGTKITLTKKEIKELDALYYEIFGTYLSDDKKKLLR